MWEREARANHLRRSLSREESCGCAWVQALDFIVFVLDPREGMVFLNLTLFVAGRRVWQHIRFKEVASINIYVRGCNLDRWVVSAVCIRRDDTTFRAMIFMNRTIACFGFYSGLRQREAPLRAKIPKQRSAGGGGPCLHLSALNPECQLLASIIDTARGKWEIMPYLLLFEVFLVPIAEA